MNQTGASLITKLNPAIPRHYLFALAGGLWTLAGALLCIRGEAWLEILPLSIECTLEAVSVGLAIVGYLFLFTKVVRKNIDRIGSLPDRACLFAFAAWRGYLMIALMMTIGITLRNSALPKHYLSVPYTTMGVILLIGSVTFYRRFLAALAK